MVYDPWICPFCNSTIEVTSALEKLQHRQVCDSQTTSGTAEGMYIVPVYIITEVFFSVIKFTRKYCYIMHMYYMYTVIGNV